MADYVDLSERWVIGARLGQGGYGQVFEGVGSDGRRVAVKFIPKEPGTDRELLFEDLSYVRHTIPIIDSGESGSNWVLVMPRATKSLRQHLNETGTLSSEETVRVLSGVATALVDLRGRVTHRDIKPENVLLLDGLWCLSDFGIARYAEASTSADTHKFAWTAPYNPPERWRGERATSASDIYSLGVMAFELLTGRLPFPGPDFRSQHLSAEPPQLTGVPAILTSLIMECLFKAADVRPIAANLLARLELVFRPSSPGAGHLQAANQVEVQRIAREGAIKSTESTLAERRQEIVGSATQALTMVLERLVQAIHDNAPTARWHSPQKTSALDFSVTLGPATLSVSSVGATRDDVWGGWKPQIQVLAYASIDIQIPPDRYQYEGRSHSLWFCDAQKESVFRWYETAFMISPLIPKRGRQDPFALGPGEEAGKALSQTLTEFQVAWPFTPLQVGDDMEFLERWMTWFASAAQGRMTHPSSMPERSPVGSWR